MRTMNIALADCYLFRQRLIERLHSEVLKGDFENRYIKKYRLKI